MNTFQNDIQLPESDLFLFGMISFYSSSNGSGFPVGGNIKFDKNNPWNIKNIGV